MTLAGLVHMICKAYGWSLEYALGLTRPQIRTLADGMKEISEIQKEIAEQERGRGPRTTYNKRGDRIVSTKQSAGSIFELAGLPGFKMSEAAKKRMNDMIKKRMKDAGN